MVAMEVSYKDFLNLAKLNVGGGGAEALELVLGAFTNIEEKGGGGGEDDGEGGLVAGRGGDCGGGAERNYCYGGRHVGGAKDSGGEERRMRMRRGRGGYRAVICVMVRWRGT